MASHYDRILEACDSSQISKIFFHNRSDWNMRVMFHNGSVYEYDNVPMRVFGLLAGADSVGSQFNAIKGDLAVRKVV